MAVASGKLAVDEGRLTAQQTAVSRTLKTKETQLRLLSERAVAMKKQIGQLTLAGQRQEALKLSQVLQASYKEVKDRRVERQRIYYLQQELDAQVCFLISSMYNILPITLIRKLSVAKVAQGQGEGSRRRQELAKLV